MNNMIVYLQVILFGALPYAVFLNFFIFTVHRYRTETFTYSSLSSQFLENREHFWGLGPLHYGIIAVLLAHFFAFLIPQAVLAWNRQPVRLYILEVTGLAFALLALLGISQAIIRRWFNAKVRQVTTSVDWIVDLLLLLQIASGIYIAVFHRWGSSWFAASVAPYFWSLLKFNPNISFLATMPWVVKLHLINFYLIIGIMPFSRLVHILVAPVPYLWRKPQLVRWYRRAVPLVGERGN